MKEDIFKHIRNSQSRIAHLQLPDFHLVQKGPFYTILKHFEEILLMKIKMFFKDENTQARAFFYDSCWCPFGFWAIDQNNYQGSFTEVDSSTLFFWRLKRSFLAKGESDHW